MTIRWFKPLQTTSSNYFILLFQCVMVSDKMKLKRFTLDQYKKRHAMTNIRWIIWQICQNFDLEFKNIIKWLHAKKLDYF